MDNVKQVEIDQLKSKLMEIISHTPCCAFSSRKAYEHIADNLIANGVRLESMQATSDKTSDENKRIEELEAELAEREKVVIQFRKQWQDAEMHICTMCGHFDHKRDSGVAYGNRNCGEIVGYPYCAGKFTPWIPVTERLPKTMQHIWAVARNIPWLQDGKQHFDAFVYDPEGYQPWMQYVTHWMPIPEPPKEETQ